MPSVNKPIGVIISSATPPTNLKFVFQMDDESEVKVGDYVEVPAGRYVIVGRVTLLKSFNEYFSNPNFVKDQLSMGFSLKARFPVNIGMWRAALVRTVAVYDGEKIHPPNVVPEPGEKVYFADKKLMKMILGLKDDGLLIGTVYGHSDIEVKIDPKILITLHLAILGTTGSGKSYTVGVIIEELLEHNYPVVVIDPHGEYRTFNQKNENVEEIEKLEKLGLKPREYMVGLFKPKNAGGTLTLDFNKLDVEALAEMAKLTSTMRDLLYLAHTSLKKKKGKITLEELITEIKEIAAEYGFQRKTLLSLERNLRMLKEMELFGEGTTSKYIVQKGALTVIDLSAEMDEELRRIFTGALLNELYQARKNREIPPLLIIVEEGHRFAPQDQDTYSKYVMRKIAREGRKFGIGLAVVSQRIIGLDKDIISQCGTKMLLRIDNKTDLDYIKQYIEGAAEDRKLVAFLPTGTAMITGQATRHPIITNIRPRKTKHGGEAVLK
ncbi:MAG: helicase HerA domain-containing protein [Candidatus Njordarchaeia archaeon]